LLVFNIIGLGLGPFVTGALSDWLATGFGEQSLRWALLCSLLASTIAGLVFLWVGPAYGREVRRLRGAAPQAD
jgi:MFS family permease